MGNISSCFNAQLNTTKLIDLQRNILRIVDVPITAAELMLEEPGLVVCPVNDFNRDFRLTAMKADEGLILGKVYVMIPVSRINGKVSDSEMEVIESACCKRRTKRRGSRVRPVATETADVCTSNDSPVKLFSEGTDMMISYRMKHWKPTLDPISEGL